MEDDLKAMKARIADIGARITSLKTADGGEERGMAVVRLIELRARDAQAEEVFTVTSRNGQNIRTTFEGMLYYPDGHIDIVTIEKGYHRFRDGNWWNEEARAWIPWAGAFFEDGYRATRAKLRRRGEWLAKAGAECPPLSREEVDRAKAS